MKIRNFFNLAIMGIAAQMLLAPGLQANQMDGYLDLSGGYRRDKVETTLKLTDDEGEEVSRDHLEIKDISIWEIGLKGRANFCNWFVRGYGYHGWITDGNFNENFSLFSLDIDADAKIDKGYTNDFTIGAGYLFPFCWCGNSWGIGPVVGWSYDQQHITLKDYKEDGVEDPDFGSFSHKTQWSGPWVGVDVVFESCGFEVDAGYEYHWASWKFDSSRSDDSDYDESFDSNFKSKDGHGNVVYIDGLWNFCPCWQAGIGLKFKSWKADKGSGHHEDEGFHLHAKDTKWCSGEITLDIGYSF